MKEKNLITSQFMVKVKDKYPPFLKGELFETYFYHYVKKHNIQLDCKYINVSWTNLYCNSHFQGIPYDSRRLQVELNILPENDKYFTIVQFDRGVQHKLPKNTIVFGCCSGDIPIPLTYENRKVFDAIKKKGWDDKTIFCSFLGRPTHAVRKLTHRYALKFKYFYHSVKGEYDTKYYIDTCVSSKFCLAPRGFGRSSFRFFEILKFGSIPVYIWDDKNWLPFKDKIDYLKLCVTLNVKDLDKLDTILKSITKEKYNEMIKYYEVNKHIFTYDGMCEEIINQLV